MKEHNNFTCLWTFEPDVPNSFGEKLEILQGMYELIVFCHPEILQFLVAAISFVTSDCKELKIAQTAQNIQLFQLLKLAFITYTDIFYG